MLQTSDALGAAGVQLGPGVVALVVELHTELGVPLAKVAHLLRTTFGLHVTPGLGGERSTAAIDSLKVIAFDVAVMRMSIEGLTHLPALLIHDSPREADLGLGVYHRLFQFVRDLEDSGDRRSFQYIVTTTTSPPSGLRMDPWLVETLGGAAEDRLLRRDL